MLSSGSRGRMLKEEGACHKLTREEKIPKSPRGKCTEEEPDWAKDSPNQDPKALMNMPQSLQGPEHACSSRE